MFGISVKARLMSSDEIKLESSSCCSFPFRSNYFGSTCYNTQFNFWTISEVDSNGNKRVSDPEISLV